MLFIRLFLESFRFAYNSLVVNQLRTFLSLLGITIGIFCIIQKTAQMGFSYLLYIMGIISASLAIFNLLPLPVLDGGHLFLSAIDKIRGKPLPQKIDEAITRVGFSLIMCLAVFVFYSDFVRYGWVDKAVGLWHKLGL